VGQQIDPEQQTQSNPDLHAKRPELVPHSSAVRIGTYLELLEKPEHYRLIEYVARLVA
jgi:hypothetical protein